MAPSEELMQSVCQRRDGRLNPSPFGRRFPEGADEGAGRVRWRCVDSALTPTPLPKGEGLGHDAVLQQSREAEVPGFLSDQTCVC